MSDLNALLRPRSVAVIGASTRPGSVGAEIFRNVLKHGFTGPVYPVNPGARSVQGVRAWPDIAAVPDRVDLAIIAVPAERVPQVVEACLAAEVKGLIVVTAGFKETGEQGAAIERDLAERVRAAGARMVGPNCLGVVTTHPEVRLDGSFAPTFPPPGTVALATQSGALGVAMLDFAAELNIGVSDFVSLGNKADVSANDVLAWWEQDERTQVVLLYLESFGNPLNFARIARRLNRRKPIVVVKAGRSARGLQAASSHTGSLAGTDRAVQALVEQCGLLRVDSVEELFDTAAFLAHQPVPKGRRVAILTNAGGPGIMATDACEGLGLEVPELSAALQARLARALPPAASTRNPVDIIASGGPVEYEHCAREILASGEVDALLALFVPPVFTDSSDVARAIGRGADGTDKPVLACFMGRHGVTEAQGELQDACIPSYAFPEAAVRVLSRAARYGEWLAEPVSEVPNLQGLDLARARRVLAGASEGWLEPERVAELLEAFGVPQPRAEVAATAGDAVGVARRLGFPVVLKLDSEEVSHKSDLGGVKVDLRNEGEVYAAFEEIAAAARAHGASMRGCLVQPLVSGGVEAIVGLTRDPTVGCLLMFGLGGVHVELLEDVAFRIPPLTDRDARELLRSVRGFPLLDGYRGAARADLVALEDLLHRMSALAMACPEVVEMDLNPVKVLARGNGCVAIDARVRVQPGRSNRT